MAAAIARALTDHWANPSSVHRAGQDARAQVELAREHVARLIGARPKDLVFTSGGTEAIDFGVRGILGTRARVSSGLPEIIASKVEHAAVRDLLEELEARGEATPRWVAVARDGTIDVASLEGLLTPSTALVVAQWANNETGAIQPVGKIAGICRARGVPFLCDAVQCVGKVPVNVGRADSIDCDLLALSAHKFHGPKGVGSLWIRPGRKLRPQLRGTQELGRRGGTENVPGIAGAGVAAQEALAWLADEHPRRQLRSLRDRFESAVLSRIPGAKVNGPATSDNERRIWNTTNIAFPRLEAEALLLLLSERGLCASAGAACSSGSLDPSPVLLAMGVPEEDAHGSLRFSLSRETTEQEIDEAAAIVADAVATLRKSMP